MGDLDDLEKLYSPSQYSKRYSPTEVLDKHIQFIEEHTNLVKEMIPQQLGVSYSPGLREKYDLYGTDLPDGSPILIHIHGGYYQYEAVTHSNNGFISNILHKYGVKTVLLGYELCPQRTVPEILEHLQIGLRECIKYAKRTKSRSIFLSGHSAGAHAIATLLSDFKRSIPSEDSSLIRGVFLIGGIYNFEPITKTSVNDLLNLSEDTAKEELSPLLDKLDYGDTAVYVIVGENDSPAFISQSRKFYDKLVADGIATHYKLVPVVDHFDVVENLFYEGYDLTRLLVEAIKAL